MDKREELTQAILKEARNAFEMASTIGDNQRIEVYLNEGKVKMSDVLDENEEILYTHDKKLCYQIYGYNYLEEEIKTWIDYARVIPEPVEGEPVKEPSDIEKSIRELITELAAKKGLSSADISSYEVFANLSMDLLGTIEQEIIEYWWSAEEEENGKKLALVQIEEALAS